MSSKPKSARRDPFDRAPPRAAKKSEPFPFVLDELASLDPFTRPMFGCLAVYAGERIVLILRDKGPGDADNGVWVGFSPEHQAAIEQALPRLEPIEVFGDKVSGWKKLPARSPEFEEDVLRVCSMILQGDARVGKIPNARRSAKNKGASPPPVTRQRATVRDEKPPPRSPVRARKR